jgi:hypothetical protein
MSFSGRGAGREGGENRKHREYPYDAFSHRIPIRRRIR